MNEMPAPPQNLQDAKNKKIAAGILGIIPITGTLGIHKFILGYTSAGLIMLLATVLTFGLASTLVWIVSLIEGILYLTKSDEEFYQTYIKEQRPWF